MSKNRQNKHTKQHEIDITHISGGIRRTEHHSLRVKDIHDAAESQPLLKKSQREKLEVHKPKTSASSGHSDISAFERTQSSERSFPQRAKRTKATERQDEVARYYSIDSNGTVRVSDSHPRDYTIQERLDALSRQLRGQNLLDDAALERVANYIGRLYKTRTAWQKLLDFFGRTSRAKSFRQIGNAIRSDRVANARLKKIERSFFDPASKILKDMTPYMPALRELIRLEPEQAKRLEEFMAVVQQLRKQNQERMNGGREPIQGQGIDPNVTELFTSHSSSIFETIVNSARNDLSTPLNDLLSSLIDWAAPQTGLDTDTYVGLHDNNSGPLKRFKASIEDIKGRVKKRHLEKWYEKAKLYGTHWALRPSQKSATIPLVESYEWRRNENGSLTRRLALARLGDDNIQHRELNLNLPPIFGREHPKREQAVMTLLEALGNKQAGQRKEFFDEWIEKNMSVFGLDRFENAQDILRLRRELMRFLSDTDRTHVGMMLAL